MSDDNNKLLEAYHFARETRDHADTLLWEVGAIVWGGQTLLLGFVLEAISGTPSPSALVLIVVVGLVGGFMAVFNERVMGVRNKVCNHMITLMIDIENRVEMLVKPQQALTNEYRPGLQMWWSRWLNRSFAIAWGTVIVVAVYRLFSFHGYSLGSNNGE